MVAGVTALRKRQASESADAGAAYQAGLDELDWHQGGEYLITDQVGVVQTGTRAGMIAARLSVPVRPAWEVVHSDGSHVGSQ